ncbi:MAG TPA: Uma2 family endonuclease [Candidatus Acidoferrales bacterium]|nr:Uma2 family endonuclease [Candidatus Acidoferrales bacterium]
MVEIKLPEAKPAFEWVNGRALQKVSPRHRHGLAQMRFAAALDAWTNTRRSGTVATEWRFHIQPAGEIRRPLVPDVAFLSYARLPYKAMLRIDEPRMAPDAVVEVRSIADRKADIEEKVRVYLSAGTHVVFLVDPLRRTVTVRDAKGITVLHERDAVVHHSLRGFRMPASDLFALVKPKRKK